MSVKANWLPLTIMFATVLIRGYFSYILWFKPQSFKRFANDYYDRLPKEWPLTELERTLSTSRWYLWTLRIFIPLFTAVCLRALVLALFAV